MQRLQICKRLLRDRGIRAKAVGRSFAVFINSTEPSYLRPPYQVWATQKDKREMSFFTLFTLGSPFVISAMVAALLKLYAYPTVDVRSQAASLQDTEEVTVEEIKTLAGCHRVAGTLHDMVDKDGVGSWPPKANHTTSFWPVALCPYKEIFFELAKLLPQA
jgi:hypothetical protein